MQAIQLLGPHTSEFGRRLAAERADAAERHELQLRAAAAIARCERLISSAQRTHPIEHRVTGPSGPVRCGNCGAMPFRRGCCSWSAGVTESRGSQQAMIIDGKRVGVEIRPASIVSIR